MPGHRAAKLAERVASTREHAQSCSIAECIHKSYRSFSAQYIVVPTYMHACVHKDGFCDELALLGLRHSTKLPEHK